MSSSLPKFRCALAIAAVQLASTVVAQDVASVEKVSFTASGAAGNADSTMPSISGDGRYVVFESDSSNLVPFDNNNSPDIFLFDRSTGVLTRRTQGSPTGSNRPVISADGQWIAFDSGSPDLLPGDVNQLRDVFVQNVQTFAIERVSRSTSGADANASCTKPAISADGRFVSFETFAGNLDPADPGSTLDVYVHDRQLGTTTRLAGPAPAIGSYHASISANGQQIAFSSGENFDPGDTGGHADVYVKDVPSGVFIPISTTPAGVFGDSDSTLPSISADGTRVAFLSGSDNLVPGMTGNQVHHVYLRDMITGALVLVSANALGTPADGDCFFPVISGDGRHVLYTSRATNLVPLDATFDEDVFAYDSLTGQTVAISVSAGGVLSQQGSSESVATSHDGMTVTYQSGAVNLMPEDSYGLRDVFVAVRGTPTYRSFCYTGNAIWCPCSNQGLDGRGCGNSTNAFGAILRAEGDPSLPADTVLLEAFGLPGNSSALVFQGTSQQAGGQGSTFGDGLRCAAGTARRLGIRTATGAGFVHMGSGVAGDAPISVLGNVPPGGATRTYQVWYRNPAPFCTPAGFNLSNGIQIVWRP